MALAGSSVAAAPRIGSFPANAAYTAFGHIYASANTNYGALIAVASGANYILVQFDSTTQNIIFTVATQGASASFATLTNGQWYDVAITYSGSTTAGALIAYIGATGDPTPMATATRTGVNLTGASFYLGGSVDGEYLNGNKANMKAWSAALTADELELERRRLMPVRFANLWTWNPLLLSSDLTDWSGNGRTATATGPTQADGPPLPWEGADALHPYAVVSGGGGFQAAWARFANPAILMPARAA